MMGVNYTELETDQLEYVAVAEESELPNGERIFLEIDDITLVVFNIAGKYFAIADVCSHDDGPIGEGEFEDEYEIACPRHGAHFDVRCGKVADVFQDLCTSARTVARPHTDIDFSQCDDSPILVFDYWGSGGFDLSL